MKNKKEEKMANKPENESSESKTVDQVQKLAADVEHWKNEYYRAYADMQNLRKIIEADHRQAIKYRAEGFVGELLPILDGFHLALSNEASSVEMKNFLTGFEYIYRNLVNVLENEGVKELAPKVGDEFNPEFMQAVETEVDNDKPNKVKKVITKGYKLHDHLIRPANVVVTVKEVEDDKKEDKDVQKVDA